MTYEELVDRTGTDVDNGALRHFDDRTGRRDSGWLRPGLPPDL